MQTRIFCNTFLCLPLHFCRNSPNTSMFAHAQTKRLALPERRNGVTRQRYAHAHACVRVIMQTYTPQVKCVTYCHTGDHRNGSDIRRHIVWSILSSCTCRRSNTVYEYRSRSLSNESENHVTKQQFDIEYSIGTVLLLRCESNIFIAILLG